MLLSVISFAIIVPYTPVGEFFEFEPPPPAFYLALAGILGAYAVLAETVKRWFYKRYGHRVEQVLVPKRKTIYLSRKAKFMQDIVAEDLKSVLNYPLNSEEMVRNLQHLRRSGLVNIDWQRRTIKREKPLKEYVEKNIVKSEMWSTLAEDWRRISGAIQNKRGNVNAEYQALLQNQK
jgi:hypothetical protein